MTVEGKPSSARLPSVSSLLNCPRLPREHRSFLYGKVIQQGAFGEPGALVRVMLNHASVTTTGRSLLVLSGSSHSDGLGVWKVEVIGRPEAHTSLSRVALIRRA